MENDPTGIINTVGGKLALEESLGTRIYTLELSVSCVINWILF